MDSELIFYIIIGVGYFIFSLYQKGKEEQMKKTVSAPTTPPSPQHEVTLEDIFKTLKKASQPQAIPPQKTTTTKPAASSMPQKVYRNTKDDKTFREEGIPSTIHAFTVSDIEDDIDPIYHEGTRATEFIQEDIHVSKENISIPYQFNARDAIIGSVIFERKY